MAEPRTHGFKTKRGVPAGEGAARVCIRCDLWFLAQPRERKCYGCLTPEERTRRVLKAPPKVIPWVDVVGSANAQVSRSEKAPSRPPKRGAETVMGRAWREQHEKHRGDDRLSFELTLDAAASNHWNGRSGACEGARHQACQSTMPCSCKCHRDQYQAA